MDAYAVDLTAILALLVGWALLMVPVLGLTLRFTLPPILDSLARLRWAAYSAEEYARTQGPRGAARGARSSASTAADSRGAA